MSDNDGGLVWPRKIDSRTQAALARIAEAAEGAAAATERLTHATNALAVAHSHVVRCTCETCPIHGEPDAA